jgi:hypothetical protein
VRRIQDVTSSLHVLVLHGPQTGSHSRAVGSHPRDRQHAVTLHRSARSRRGCCTVICALGTLASGASATATIKVTATTPGTLTDSASVAADNVTRDSDDVAAATTLVQGT